MSTQLTPTRHAIVLSPPKRDGDFSHVNPQRTATKDIRIGGREMVMVLSVMGRRSPVKASVASFTFGMAFLLKRTCAVTVSFADKLLTTSSQRTCPLTVR